MKDWKDNEIEVLRSAVDMLRRENESLEMRRSEPIEVTVARIERSHRITELESEVYRLQRENYFLRNGIGKEEMEKYLLTIKKR